MTYYRQMMSLLKMFMLQLLRPSQNLNDETITKLAPCFCSGCSPSAVLARWLESDSPICLFGHCHHAVPLSDMPLGSDLLAQRSIEKYTFI